MAAPSGGTFRGNMGGSALHSGSRGDNRASGITSSGAARGHIGSVGASRAGTLGVTHASMSPRTTGIGVGRSTSGSFVANHFSANHGASGGSLGGHHTAASGTSFSTRHFGASGSSGIGGHTATSGGLGKLFSARHSQGFAGNRGNTSVVNNYNSFGSRYGGFGGNNWGSRSFGYGFGYPYLGYSYGLGRGLFSSLLYGVGGYGYGGYGYNRFGYGGFGGYGNNWGYGGYGSGNGYAYNPYCSATTQYVSYGPGTTSPITYASASPAISTAAFPLPQNPSPSGNDTTANAGGFADKGEAAFKAGDYKGAVYAWRHAVIDDSQNPVVLMLLGQALFATGKFEEAAGATQSAMQTLPKEQWGVVAKNYKELYGSVQDYTDQLRALEKSVSDKPDDLAQRFLLGFHYAYLGYPQQAVDQLDKLLKAAPSDEMAKQLRDEMRSKLPKPVAPLAPPTSK